MTCIECQRPARAIQATDIASDHCSDACELATIASLARVRQLTPRKIDEALSTTGWSVPDEVLS